MQYTGLGVRLLAALVNFPIERAQKTQSLPLGLVGDLARKALDQIAIAEPRDVRRNVGLDHFHVTDRQSVGPIGEDVEKRVSVLSPYFGAALDDKSLGKSLEPNIRNHVAVEVHAIRRARRPRLD